MIATSAVRMKATLFFVDENKQQLFIWNSLKAWSFKMCCKDSMDKEKYLITSEFAKCKLFKIAKIPPNYKTSMKILDNSNAVLIRAGWGFYLN